MSLRIGRQPGLAGGGVTSAVPPDEADENERRSRPMPTIVLRRIFPQDSLMKPLISQETSLQVRQNSAISEEITNFMSYVFDVAPSELAFDCSGWSMAEDYVKISGMNATRRYGRSKRTTRASSDRTVRLSVRALGHR